MQKPRYLLPRPTAQFSKLNLTQSLAFSVIKNRVHRQVSKVQSSWEFVNSIGDGLFQREKVECDNFEEIIGNLAGILVAAREDYTVEEEELGYTSSEKEKVSESFSFFTKMSILVSKDFLPLVSA